MGDFKLIQTILCSSCRQENENWDDTNYINTATLSGEIMSADDMNFINTATLTGDIMSTDDINYTNTATLTGEWVNDSI